MMMNDHLKLYIECIEWFNYRFPHHSDCLHLVPLGKFKATTSKLPWKKGFHIHTQQMRLAFTLRQRVCFFYYDSNDCIMSAFEYANKNECDLKIISSLDDFTRHAMKRMAEYNLL